MPPVTLSGFNNIDFQAVLDAIMAQERLPSAALGAKRATLQHESAQLKTFATKLSALQSAADTLRTPDALSLLTAASSDPSILTVGTTRGTTAGTYHIVVHRRASAQVTASTAAVGLTDVVATEGAIALRIGSEEPVEIAARPGMTVRQLADAVNAASAGVSASVVQVTPGRYRLVFTADRTGTENAFTFTSTLSGGVGLSFHDDGNGVYGEVVDGNAVAAADAEVTANNLSVTSHSNTLTDVIPGATLTLTGEDAGRAVQVTVTRDSSATRTRVDALVKAYNDLVAWANAQRLAAVGGEAGRGRDSLIGSLRYELRQTLLRSVGAHTTTSLASVGIGFDRSGSMTVASRLFDGALSSTPATVMALFAGADGTSGVFDDVFSVLERYTRTDGTVKTAHAKLEDRMKQMSRRMDTLEAQLAIRRDALQRQFVAADQAMQRLNGQVGALTTLAGQYRLF